MSGFGGQEESVQYRESYAESNMLSEFGGLEESVQYRESYAESNMLSGFGGWEESDRYGGRYMQVVLGRLSFLRSFCLSLLHGIMTDLKQQFTPLTFLHT